MTQTHTQPLSLIHAIRFALHGKLLFELKFILFAEINDIYFKIRWKLALFRVVSSRITFFNETSHEKKKK